MGINNKIAVFFDCENVSAKFVKEIFDELANYGEVSIRKAYTNWSDKKSKYWHNKLREFAIEAIQVFPNILNKNSSDIKMVIDVMNTMNTSKIDTVVLVSSDSDFTDLVIDIKAKGFEVIGFGETKTVKSLRNAYSTFIELPIKDQSVSSNEKDLIITLTDAINKTKNDNDYALISKVGTYLKNKNASLVAKNYGANTWGDIFKRYPKNFELTHEDNRKSICIVKIKNSDI